MVTTNEEFLFIGHRGLREKVIENSLKGFRLAKDYGLDGIELDVQLSKDKQIIVYHDFYAGRLTALEGMIYDYSYEDLKKVKLDESQEQIPTLSDVIKETGDFRYLIELKTLDDDYLEVNEGIEKKVLDLLHLFRNSKAVLISFNIRSLQRVRELDSRIETGFLLDEELLEKFPKINKDLIENSGIAYILPSFELLRNKNSFKDLSKSKKIIVWNVKNFEEALESKEAGAMGIISDFCLEIKDNFRKKSGTVSQG